MRSAPCTPWCHLVPHSHSLPARPYPRDRCGALSLPTVCQPSPPQALHQRVHHLSTCDRQAGRQAGRASAVAEDWKRGRLCGRSRGGEDLKRGAAPAEEQRREGRDIRGASDARPRVWQEEARGQCAEANGGVQATARQCVKAEGQQGGRRCEAHCPPQGCRCALASPAMLAPLQRILAERLGAGRGRLAVGHPARDGVEGQRGRCW